MKTKYYVFRFPLLAFLLIYLPSLTAQVTEGFNYQAVARDALGEILPDTDIELRMSITTDPNAPGVVYSEEHLVTSDAFGMVNVVIGEGTPSNGDFEDIDWDENEHFLMIRMNFDGIDAELPPVKFQAVPYAKVAATTSDKLWQETGEPDMSIYYNDGPVGIGTLEPQRNLEIAQTFDDVFLRLHSQGSPAGTAMIELVRGNAFGASDWRIGNTGSGFAFQRASDNFLTEPDETPLFISNSGQVGIGQTNPIYPLDIASNGEDYNAISISGSLLNLNYEYCKPTLLFGIPNSLGGLIQNVDFRLVNDGNSFRLERSFDEFSDAPETMWSINDDNGHMNMHFHKIVDMADPTQGDHAVTLSYMNSAIDDALAAITIDPLELGNISSVPISAPQCSNECKGLIQNGYDDWRIPTIEELASFFSSYYVDEYVWSITPSPSFYFDSNNTLIYRFYVHNNYSGRTRHESENNLRCRCVRGKN